MSAPEWLLHKHRFEAMSLRVDEVDEDDLLILGVHEHAQPPDAQLLAVQQVLERLRSDAEQALPGGAAAVRLRSLLAEANANTRVRVAVVAPQQGQGGSATAAQLTQLFARRTRMARAAGGADDQLGVLPNGVHARALDVPPAEPAPDWCTWSSVVVVVLHPYHTRTATEAVLTTALRYHSADSVFVALLRCDDESKLAAASGSVVDVTTSMSVPAAQVAVAPVNDTTTTTEEEARPACAPRLHDGTSTASAALSLTDFDEWFASLRAAILASVERKLAAALQVLREVLPTVRMWMALREDSSKPSQLVAWLISKAVEGLPNLNLSGAHELAQLHRSGNPTLERAAMCHLVNKNSAVTFGSGFLTGIGGFVTFPIAVPTALGIASVLRFRLCLCFASLAGHSEIDPTTVASVLLCVYGADASRVLHAEFPPLVPETAVGEEVRAKSVVDEVTPTVLLGRCEAAAATYAESVRSRVHDHAPALATCADSIAAEAYRMRLPLEVVRRLPGVMFARVTGNVLAYGAELVPVVGGVISGGVDAGLTKVAGHVALNLFFPPPRSACEPSPSTETTIPRAGAPMFPPAVTAQAKQAAAEARSAAAQAGKWMHATQSKAGVWASGVWEKARKAHQQGSLSGRKPKEVNAESWRAVLSHTMAQRAQQEKPLVESS